MTFIIKSVRETGTITYHCATPRTAFDKVQDYRRAEYSDIVILTSDSDVIPESTLASLIDVEQTPSMAA